RSSLHSFPTRRSSDLIFISSCNSSREQSNETLEQKTAGQVSSLDSHASNPFLSKNHLGHPVLCWTEELSDGDGFVVKYTVFDPEDRKSTRLNSSHVEI